jgi:hypothetical protein
MSGKLWDRKFLKQNLIGLGILILIPVSVVTCEWRNRVQNKAECRHFLNQIRLGDARSDVRGKFAAGGYRQLSLYPDANLISGNPDLVTAINQFGAKNWCIFIFYEESKVVAVKVRTGDGITDHPSDAPPDLGKVGPPAFEPLKD